MVIIATPNDPLPSGSSSCAAPDTPPPPNLVPLECAAEQEIVAEGGLTLNLEQGTAITQDQTAPISKINGVSVFARQRAITISQGQAVTIKWQMVDKAGVPLNLTPLVSDPTLKVVFRVKEQVALGNDIPPVQVDASIVTAEVGEIEADLTAVQTRLPGVYYGEMALISTLTNPVSVLAINVFSLIINRSTFGEQNYGGAPSIAEIRLHLRDSAPNESFLLDNLMFDDAEIALAISRPIMYWNEIPPPIATFTTQNFPFRYHWLEGICANLFFMVAEQFRRNQLDYAAAGVTVNDQNKEGNYEQAGQRRWDAYREWVRLKKAQINLEGAYGQVGSLYQYGAYSSGIRSRY